MKKIAFLLIALAMSFTGMAQLVAHYDFTNTGLSGIAVEPVNTLTGAATNCLPAAGKSGIANTAIKLDGSTSFVYVAPDALLNLTTWTIQAIVWIDDFNTTTRCQVSKILQHGTQYGTNYYALEINDNNDDPQQFNGCNSPVDTNNMNFFGAAAGLPVGLYGSPFVPVHTGRWYCLTATYDDNRMRYYIDGMLTYTLVWNQQYNYSGGPVQLLIGSGTGSGGDTYWFNGIIDDIAIYNRALTANEVAGICPSVPPPCSVDDIGYCSALSTPFQYTFTPTVSPAGSQVTWTIDGTHYGPMPGTAPVTHTFTGFGTKSICLTVLDAQGQPCATRCFNMCLDKVSGAKSSPGSETGININTYEQGVGMLYPNPVTSVLNIPVQGMKGQVTMSVMSIDGMKISSKTSTVSGSASLLQLNTAELKPGTYLLEMTNGGQKVIRKFSKL